MKTEAGSVYPTSSFVVTIIAGIALCLTTQVYLGIPLLLIGLFMAFAQNTVWRCRECQFTIEKAEVLG